MKKKIFIFIVLLFIGVLLISCQLFERSKWTPPKFVKEWEIKEIKPGLPYSIASINANKNGVFVLVKAKETKYTPPKKWEELTDEEKKEEIKDMKLFFGRILSEEERLSDKGGIFSKREEIKYLRIQHYDHEGNLIREWTLEKFGLKEPTKILSDSSGNIYTADYEGNEIIKLNANGVLQDRWKMLPRKQIDRGSFFNKGVTIDKNDHILILGSGELFITPKLFEYNTNGKLIRSKELEAEKEVDSELSENQSPYQKMKFEMETIIDIEVDDKGNIFLLKLEFENILITPYLIKLNPEWEEESKTKVVLKNELDADKMKQFEKIGIGDKGFDSTQFSWVDTVPGFYFASNIFFDGKYLYVLFLGSKPFGIIDAAIYNTKGKMVGYWKQDSRSNMEWDKSLGKDIEVVDYDLYLSHYGKSLFIARTMHIRKGAFYEKSVIQKFDKV